MDRRDTRTGRSERGPGWRKSRAGLASGVPGTHAPEPGHGFAVPPPTRTVSPEATERTPPVDPGRGFAVPAPTRLATTTLERARPPAHGRHEAPVRHQWLTNRLRQVPGTRRFGLAAGQVLVVLLICMLVWTVLSAHSLHKSSEAAPGGARRDASLAVLGPIDGLTHLLFIDRLAGVFQGLVGHDPDKVSPGGFVDGPPVGPPPTQPTLPATSGPPGGATSAPHGNGNGNGHGNGNGNGHPTTKPTKPGHGNGNGNGNGGPKLADLRVPSAANPLRVLVVGDSFAEGLEIGLAPVTNSKYFRLIQKGLHSTGLARPDYFDWPAALRVFVTQYHPDILLVMLGGNDANAIYTPGSTIPFGVGDERWRATYRDRIDKMMEIGAEGGAHVAWVGLPIMGDARFSDNMHTLDGMFAREAEAHPDVLYLDTYEMFSKDGKYTDYLPNEQGNLQLVRAGDHTHFTAVGDRMVATELLRMMKFRAGWHLSPKVRE